MAIREKPHAVSGSVSKLAEFLCFAIYSANLTINRAYKPLLDKLGLTYPQYLVLAALYDQDEQTVGSLGEKLFLELEHANSSVEADGESGIPHPST